MAKKLMFILLSLVIATAGTIGFSKLHYWERSVRIFDYKEMDRRFEGRGGRGAGNFERPPREQFEGRGEQGVVREFRARPDGEFRARPERDTTERPEGEFRDRPEGRASFGPGDRGRGGHGRGDIHGGKKVRLRSVLWFLAVFSGFTVVTVYLDRIWLFFRKRRKESVQ